MSRQIVYNRSSSLAYKSQSSLKFTALFTQQFMHLYNGSVTHIVNVLLCPKNNRHLHFNDVCPAWAVLLILESLLLPLLNTHVDDCNKYQFSFKAGHSTGLCTNVFKNVISYYTLEWQSCFHLLCRLFEGY